MDAIQVISVGITALVAVIGVFWKMHLNNISESKEKLNQLETKDQSNTKELMSLSNRVTELEATREGYTAGVDKVIAEVIKDIRASRGK